MDEFINELYIKEKKMTIYPILNESNIIYTCSLSCACASQSSSKLVFCSIISLINTQKTKFMFTKATHKFFNIYSKHVSPNLQHK